MKQHDTAPIISRSAMIIYLNTLRYWYAAHQKWAIQSALEAPLLAMLYIGTLGLWYLAPFIFFGVPSIFFWHAEHHIIATILGSIGFLFTIEPFSRLLEWYFMAMGIMLGTGASARQKLAELEHKHFQKLGK